MTFHPQHSGLYFTSAHIQAAQANRTQEPLTWAWAWLGASVGTTIRERLTPTRENKKATTPVIKPDLTEFEQALVAGYRYRFADDSAGLTHALARLQEGLGFTDQPTLTATIQHLISAGQLFEMLRESDLMATFAPDWLAHFADRAQALRTQPTDLIHESLWQTTLSIVAGVILENAVWFDEGVQALRQAIDTIHPEGYLKSAVEGNDSASFERMLACVGALALGAEVATHAGEPLWTYENRGVGIVTSATYMVYYYFYPDKWKWASGITPEFARETFAQWGAFLEIANHHSAVRGVDILLDEQRPYFNALVGGFTTLSHSAKLSAEKKKRWW